MFLHHLTIKSLASWAFITLLGTVLFAGCVAATTQPEGTPAPPTQAGGTPGLSTQYVITAVDSGKIFTYNVTTRFSVELDPAQYPKQALNCSPEGIIGSISNIPEVQPPLYAVRYEAVQPGECLLKNGDFQVTIRVVE